MARQAGGYYGSASDTVSSTHKDNMQRFHNSRQTYFSKIQETVEVGLGLAQLPAPPACAADHPPLRLAINSRLCAQYVKQHGLVCSARATADTLLAQVKEAGRASEKQASFATEKVKETWSSFLSLPIGAHVWL